MVTRNGELVQLSRTEWLLLQHLAANAGKVVLHTELLTKVWGPEYRDDLQYLRVWVSRVRRKLGAEPGEPGRIKTFQGIGYLLDVEPPVAARDGGTGAGPGRALGPHRVVRLARIEAAPPAPLLCAAATSDARRPCRRPRPDAGDCIPDAHGRSLASIGPFDRIDDVTVSRDDWPTRSIGRSPPGPAITVPG